MHSMKVGTCPSMSFFVSILIPSRFQDLPHLQVPSSFHCRTGIMPTPPSVRPFPFTLPYVRSPISSPQSCTSNGDKHSPNEIYLPISFLHVLFSIRACPCHARACLLKSPRFFVVNFHSNTLHECQALYMATLRGSRTGTISREGGGFKTRAHVV